MPGNVISVVVHTARRPRLGLTRLSQPRDSNQDAYFNTVDMFVLQRETFALFLAYAEGIAPTHTTGSHV